MILLLVSLLMAATAAAWVVAPVFARRYAVLADIASGAVLDADSRRRSALASLKDLEYDWLGGKLDDVDYAAQKQRLSREALQAMRTADAVRAAPGAGAAAPAASAAHACGFANSAGSAFCAGCGERLA